ncbi:hypothetical protein [Mycoplasmopsis felifaucium]|uniref:hypothetical protein n=1 Tax=Mycoplasmopsis felifaucium TaxID=35768 RepID=UPI000481D571|nr:hypothetical protein [Mycoplasmopsis felifaucium]
MNNSKIRKLAIVNIVLFSIYVIFQTLSVLTYKYAKTQMLLDNNSLFYFNAIATVIALGCLTAFFIIQIIICTKWNFKHYLITLFICGCVVLPIGFVACCLIVANKAINE